MKKLFNKAIVRYVVVGLINTSITYLLYLITLNFFSYTISYGISYVLGIVVSFLLNVIFVFQTNFSIKKVLQFPAVYIIQFLLNTFCLFILVDKLNFNEKLSPLLVIIISIPITFTLTKAILITKKGGKTK